MARFCFSAFTLACIASLQTAQAQTSATPLVSPTAPAAQSITITGRASLRNAATVAGFGDVPLAQSPYSGSVISRQQLLEAGITSLSDITRLDAAITDAYNAPGYWGELAVRGYILDARSNYRRDGLPINAETALPTGNKQALEIFKGVSGFQAGTSAPGGLANLVVKRPQGNFSTASLVATDNGDLTLALDTSRRTGAGLAWRLNLEAQNLRPRVYNTDGQRQLAALAFELPLSPTGLLEAELEWSHQSQPSVPGFSLLGNRLPAASAVNPRINLNNQAWSLPVVFDGTTASLRYTHTLDNDWALVAHAMQQSLRTEDRVAFPYGCSSENTYTRYCSDGSFDLYDFRSEGEKRSSTALDFSVTGRVRAVGITHHVGAGLLHTQTRAHFNQQAYNWVGIGTVDGLAVAPSDPALTDQNTHRTEGSTEWRVQDRIEITPALQLWLGLRHSRIERDSVRTDGSRPTAYTQSFTTPWLGITYDLQPGLMAYVNLGQGVESEVAPNRSRYNNPGQPLPALKSSQLEVGLKQRAGDLTWAVALFDVERPLWRDIGTCDAAQTCTRQQDGTQRHHGIEAEAEWSTGPVSLRGSALLLKARQQNTQGPGLNGLQPTNVPARTLKLQAAYNVASKPGLSVLAFATQEGRRMVLPDNSVATPGWTRWDIGLRYATRLAGLQTTWRLGVDNLTDQRAWKEAPYKFEHAYLYPLAARQWHASTQMRW